MYKDLKGQGNRIVWMKLNHHIPQNIEINQTLSYLLVKYPGQVNTCHTCGLTGHESRICKTSIDQRVNKIDVDLNSKKLKNNITSVDSDIAVHINSSFDSIKYACERCDYSCTDEAILKVHTATHTGEKPFKCNNCENEFKSKSDLEIHLSTHTGEQPFKCNVCGKNFKGKQKLNDHSKVHEGQSRHTSKNKKKNNKCKKSVFTSDEIEEICEIDTSLLANLSLNEKPFACKKCCFQFSATHELNNHSLSHRKANMFKCTECDYASLSENALNKHRKIHFYKRLECTECDRQFTSISELTLHMVWHTEEKAIDECYVDDVDECSQKTVSTSKSVKRCMSTSPEGRPSTKQRA